MVYDNSRLIEANQRSVISSTTGFPGEEQTLIFVKEKILDGHMTYFTSEYLRVLYSN